MKSKTHWVERAAAAAPLALSLALAAPAAHALPSFARQTGMPCVACHSPFPQLTPFGRSFKLNGYTLAKPGWNYNHFAGMVMADFLHTASPNPGNKAAPAGFSDNNNFELNQASFFYGGRLASHVGIFSQFTYDGEGKAFGWDNLDLRFADSTVVGGKQLVYGLTANNNPTVQDLWNSTPAWGYPFAGPGDSLATGGVPDVYMNGLGGQVMGVGAYAMWNNLVYAEFDAYNSLPNRAQIDLGAGAGNDQTDGVAPYWRLALQKSWGPQNLEVGTFGMVTKVHPGGDNSVPTNKYTDLGFDSQYQYIAGMHSFTGQLRYTHESQTGGAHDKVDNLLLHLGYLYDNTYGADLAFQHGKETGPDNPGTGDAWILQANYLPFNKSGGPSVDPELNVKLTLQYTAYTTLSGNNACGIGSGSASDCNMLMFMSWIMF